VAELELEMKELSAALSHARRGVHIAEQIRAESDLAESYRVLGEAALGLGKVEEALDACLRALEIAKNVGRDYLDEVVLTLARVCARAAETPPLRARAEEARDALQAMLTQGSIDGELRERVEISLAMVGEFLG
jgi:tetratricopeptide (TPR) repeat protein